MNKARDMINKIGKMGEKSLTELCLPPDDYQAIRKELHLRRCTSEGHSVDVYGSHIQIGNVKVHDGRFKR